jgi:hypothetical protein
MKALTKRRPGADAPKAGRAEGKRNLSGDYAAGLWSDEQAALLGRIAGTMPQVEELMAELVGMHLGGGDAPGQMFRALPDDEGRVKTLRTLSEAVGIDGGTAPGIDAAVGEYAAARGRWRAYRDGLWYTHEGGRTFLAAPARDATSFLVAREVKPAELEADLARVTALTEQLLRLTRSEVRVRKPPASRNGTTMARRGPEPARAKRPAPQREPGKRRRRRAVRNAKS